MVWSSEAEVDRTGAIGPAGTAVSTIRAGLAVIVAADDDGGGDGARGAAAPLAPATGGATAASGSRRFDDRVSSIVSEGDGNK